SDDVDHLLENFVGFSFNDTAPTYLHTLTLHDALPIFPAPEGLDEALVLRDVGQHPQLDLGVVSREEHPARLARHKGAPDPLPLLDRKSTRLNSSHVKISYAVFCLKKIKQKRR